MEVILLEKIRRLGVLGNTVNVKSGYARNFLIPQGKAVYATPANLEKFEQRRAELEKIAAERHSKAVARQTKINALAPLSVTAKVGEEGKLFGSVSVREIVNLLNEAGAEIEKREVCLTEGALRMVGEYDIKIELDSDVFASVKLNIIGEA